MQIRKTTGIMTCGRENQKPQAEAPAAGLKATDQEAGESAWINACSAQEARSIELIRPI